VNKRIRAGEKEAEEIKKRVIDQKKTLERLERDLAGVQDGEWPWIVRMLSWTHCSVVSGLETSIVANLNP
jgi:hypothetical protein